MTFLPYFTTRFCGLAQCAGTLTLWDVTTRLPVTLTIVAATTIALAAVGWRTNSRLPVLLAACLSFYLFGQFFPVGGGEYEGLGVGFWLATFGTIVMSIGGVVAVSSGFAQERSPVGPAVRDPSKQWTIAAGLWFVAGGVLAALGTISVALVMFAAGGISLAFARLAR